MGKEEDISLEEAFDEVATLVDEKGNELKFNWEMSVEYGGNTYAILSPAQEIEGFEEDSAVIFRLSDDDENPKLEEVEDDDIIDAVYNEYINILDEQDMEEDEDDDDDEEEEE